MKQTFFFYLQIILTVLSGFCGLTLLIGGIYMHSFMASFIGACGLVLPLIWIKCNN